MGEVDEALVGALEELRESLSELRFPLATPARESGTDGAADTVAQLSDYVIPRLWNVSAPLIAVVGGSTGSGKSTIVNSLVGEVVTRSSALRPTTRQPVLIHAVGEEQWFTPERVFPGLARVAEARSAEANSAHPGSAQPAPAEASSFAAPATNELRMVGSSALPSGLAIVDSPDIDSVVADNRQLAAQLLAAADLWIFVTTAARYADAIPWAMLDDARERHVVLAVVLNRVPAGVAQEIRPDLARELENHGLGSAPLFVIGEGPGPVDQLPSGDIEPLRGWLHGLASDAQARASVARQTLEGTLASILNRKDFILHAYTEQLAQEQALRDSAHAGVGQALGSLAEALADGQLLRGEVLRRWQEIVGTGDFMRKLESGVASVRDRISSWLRGKEQPTGEAEVAEAIEDSLQAVLVAGATGMISRIRADFERTPSGAGLATAAWGRLRPADQREEAAGRLVRDWQRATLEMLRGEGESKRTTARIAALGVNAVGVALMVVVFAQTAGLTGGEVAIAGGTAVVAQRVLEAIFGDDAVRRMAKNARTDLLERARDFFLTDAGAFLAEVDRLGISEQYLDGAGAAFDNAWRALREGEVAWR